MLHSLRQQIATNRFAPLSGLRRFGRRDDGSMAVFSVFVFFAMLLVGGLAIDMMRNENERVRMQNTADRAVLAATSLRENVSNATPQQIVDAYFAAEGLTAQLGGRVIVEEDAETGRTVTVVPCSPSRTSISRSAQVSAAMSRVPTLAVVSPARIEPVMVSSGNEALTRTS